MLAWKPQPLLSWWENAELTNGPLQNQLHLCQDLGQIICLSSEVSSQMVYHVWEDLMFTLACHPESSSFAIWSLACLAKSIVLVRGRARPKRNDMAGVDPGCRARTGGTLARQLHRRDFGQSLDDGAFVNAGRQQRWPSGNHRRRISV
jgi:hypothetical protein